MIMIGFWAALTLGIVSAFVVERRRRKKFMQRAEAGDVRPEEYGGVEHDITPLGAEAIFREIYRR